MRNYSIRNEQVMLLRLLIMLALHHSPTLLTGKLIKTLSFMANGQDLVYKNQMLFV